MRPYYCHRGAHAPRISLVFCLLVPISVAISLLAHPPLILNLVFSFVLGASASRVQWAIWRRRHPIITVEQHYAALREAAPWN